jgi:hypothetical protein
VLNIKASNTNFIVFGLTRSELKPTIYHTQGEHANHYTIDVVVLLVQISSGQVDFDSLLVLDMQHLPTDKKDK